MTIPKWALSLIAVAAAAVSALVTGATVSYHAGSVLAEMTAELRHLRETITPAVVQVALHENRIGVVETRISYCCPPSGSQTAAELDALNHIVAEVAP